MLVKINTVDNGGMVTDTRTEKFSYALALTSIYVRKSGNTAQVFNEHNLNDGWTVEMVSRSGRVTTYDFQPIID